MYIFIYNTDMSGYVSLFYLKQITPYSSGLKPYLLILAVLLAWVNLYDNCTQTDMKGPMDWAFSCVGGWHHHES